MSRKAVLATAAVLLVNFLFMVIFVPEVNVNGLSNLNSRNYFAQTGAIDSNLKGGDVAVPSWSFDTARNWGSFAYVNNYYAQVVIGLDRSPQGISGSLSRVLAKYDGRIMRQVSDSGSVWAVVANVPFDTLNAFARDIKGSKLASYIEPNFRFHVDFTPDDPDFYYQYGLKKIEADKAWDTQRGSSTVLVAVVDTGIDWNHPDLRANYVSLGYDWVNNDNNPMDDNGHGTHVAGIIGATINNSIGVAGLAQVRIMAEKALNSTGDGLEDQLASAIYHAVDQGAKIINMSWGDYINSTLIFNAVKYAYDAGVLLTAAAGNDAVATKMFPAAYYQVVAVTATDSNDNPASLTNFGSWVELAAPGVGIWSTYWTAYFGSTYAPMTGTSMAAPFVSGVAALLWSQFPHLTRDQVRMRLRDTADDMGSPGFDDYYGYGRINARKALQAHDVGVTEVKPHKTVIGQGFSDNVNVTVVNYGPFAEVTNVTLYTQLQNGLGGYSSAQVQPVTLGVGVSKSVVFFWNTSGLSKGNYTLSASLVPVLGEVWVDDNIFVFGTVFVGMSGDVAGVGVFPETFPDGRVDLTDLSLIARVFGVFSWDVRFVSNYDICHDGRVDIRDLAVAAMNFEKVDP